jgi:hypothetical protein
MLILLTFTSVSVVLFFVLWRKLMSSSTDLVNAATALAAAANALSATATAVNTLVASLKATPQLIDQPTLDSVVASLGTSVTAIQAAQTELAALVPPTPAA